MPAWDGKGLTKPERAALGEYGRPFPPPSEPGAGRGLAEDPFPSASVSESSLGPQAERVHRRCRHGNAGQPTPGGLPGTHV